MPTRGVPSASWTVFGAGAGTLVVFADVAVALDVVVGGVVVGEILPAAESRDTTDTDLAPPQPHMKPRAAALEPFFFFFFDGRP